MTNFVDNAADVMARVRKQQEVELSDKPDQNPAPETFTESSNRLLRKLKPEWGKADRNALAQVRAAANAQIQDTFGAAMEALDGLYRSVRVPKLNPMGRPMTEAGRVIWETDEHSRPVTDWSRLDGSDIETCLLTLVEVKLVASQRVTQLKQEALLAKYTFDDSHFSAYESVVEGTVGDRNAVANRKTIDEKYNYWLRYYLYDMANAFLEELKSVERLLTNLRYWHIRETPQ